MVLAEIELPVIGPFEPAAHARQRGPQIMRDVVGDLPVRLDELLDAVEHRIEVGGKPIPFIPSAAQRYALAQPGFDNFAARCVYRFDPRDRPA